ncbi:MAG TPA: DUF58 domain-containing protein [Candidatus Polarisedimenticolia bacterium]|jgi:uncharacterized protein (DUF58 family)|nr:DUF58 domain-containing protein [Candidatus Polarisedimenticolia bacterium]
MPLSSQEILKKVRRIEIRTNRLVNESLAGEYHSVFKGRGMEFDEVREYTPGDDVRTIDWNVTSRMGHPYVKKYVEERELTVMLLVDASASGDFGTVGSTKRAMAAEVCALLAFSAIRNNDRVGLLVFTDREERYVPPRKGRNHVLRVIREILTYEPSGRRTNLALALESLARGIRRRSVAFVVSDFLDSGFERALRLANRKHDLIALALSDPREMELPPVGILELEDAETGARILVDTWDRKALRLFAQQARERAEVRRRLFRQNEVDFVELSTARPYDVPLVRFFHERARRLR